MIILESLAKRIVLTVDRPQRWLKPEVCGKIRTGRPRQVAPTRLPAVSLCEKGGVLGGSGICRMFSKATIKKTERSKQESATKSLPKTAP
jgi:hypothetical protein